MEGLLWGGQIFLLTTIIIAFEYLQVNWNQAA